MRLHACMAQCVAWSIEESLLYCFSRCVSMYTWHNVINNYSKGVFDQAYVIENWLYEPAYSSRHTSRHAHMSTQLYLWYLKYCIVYIHGIYIYTHLVHLAVVNLHVEQKRYCRNGQNSAWIFRLFLFSVFFGLIDLVNFCSKIHENDVRNKAKIILFFCGLWTNHKYLQNCSTCTKPQ